MTLKQWTGMFLGAMLLCSALYAGFNALVDPFGLFGDRMLGWWPYNMTQNPRTAKIGWLDEHHEDYDSYIIGCSKTSSFPTELLNRYYGARFYNMTMYGGDFYDVEKTVEYVLKNYRAKNIIVNTGLAELLKYDYEDDDMKGNLHAKVGGSSTLRFYARYLLANPRYALDKLRAYREDTYLVNPSKVFDPVTGAYDKSLRDVEPIGSLEEYLAKYPEFVWHRGIYESLDAVDACVAAMERVKEMCREAGATLTLIISPLSASELDMYPMEDLARFFRKMSSVTDFWDFSGYHSIACEPRYFYDIYHHRNAVGVMALARMFGDDSVYVPEDFGVYVTNENVDARLEDYVREKPARQKNDCQVPILMYHHIDHEPQGDWVVSTTTFRAHVRALKERGYEAISFTDLIDFVERGKALPEKPVVITFDDGYKSAVDIAAPILKEYGMRAAVNVIGVSVGKGTYKDTGKPITPHFSFEEAVPWVREEVLEIQCHSFDMHNTDLDGDGHRQGVLQKPGETEEEYIAASKADVAACMRMIEEGVGVPPTVFAYPYGLYTDLSEVLLSEAGIKVTLTVEPGMNTVVKGLPQSLRALKRIPVGELSPDALLEQLEGLRSDD